MAFEGKRNLSRRKKGNTTRGLKRVNNDIIIPTVERKSDHEEDSNWSNSVDEEDYIIFCFREDGAFEVLKNDKPDEATSNHADSKSRINSRPVNRKLNYEGKANEERFTGKAHETYLTNYDGCTHQKEAEEENIHLEADSFCGDNFEGQSSDASAGSFAFPALRWEWIGSPERMPNSDGFHSRKHKARCIGFQCCRF
ncbi:hypothetical protein L484_016672 [Morus notabilis]|uniref:Protein BREAKING OF ASYMMETRY IN THE STOMATAL LINEAGE n=1 Tax=Morus notabilis TaxID=981085 RepID=W9S533_9ROSA|nr:protein BREAKING OF ASYMMETRY IN THE STOMATAL LINEAGE [Morus notabilis]EXB89112.1 hypothetical protein L484_016672 [Morus notabilis]